MEKGAPLFTVDPDLQQADVEMAKASVTNATQAYERAQTLLKTSAGTQKRVEDAEAALRTAQARLASAQTRLARRKAASPVTGSVQQIYYRPGELVPAGRPVVSLLPPGNIKIRFFVPETVLPHVALGEGVTIHCDGCKTDVTAKVTFISRTSEFTPPVIYSLDERAKLVFLIEARHRHAGRASRRPAGGRRCWSRRRASERRTDIVIDVHGLTKKFDGRAVVRDLSMQVKRGTIYGFLGPNGSGKTTTIRMLCGLLTPDEGTGTCLGYDIRTETDKIKRQVGYMTQRFSLYQDLSVRRIWNSSRASMASRSRPRRRAR